MAKEYFNVIESRWDLQADLLLVICLYKIKEAT